MKRPGLTVLHVFAGATALALAAAVAGPQTEFQSREEALAALGKYTRMIEADPKYAVFFTLRGDACYALNDLYGAMQSYTAAIKLDGRQDNAYFGRGMALGRMGMVDEGIADLNVYIQRHPDSSVAYTKRGVRNIWRNNLADAERDLARALELDPKNAEAHDDLGVVHAKHNRIKQAADHFSTAIRLDPTYQKAYHNLAILFYMMGQYQEALEIVDEGLMLNHDNRNSLLLKASVLKALGRTEEAKQVAEHAEFLPEDNWSERSVIGDTAKNGEHK
jgi:tetratricopeptide (TPR) repeat protein